MGKDSLGDRIKRYEKHETQRRVIDRLPVCVRIDGRAFHTFTKGLTRPFDASFSRVMVEVAKYLVEQTNPRIGYTQSDEITLIFFDDSVDSHRLFGGKIFKLTSVLSSMATAKFISLIPTMLKAKIGELPTFDCRVFQLPSLEEAANVLLWRWLDARKNSISSAASFYFSEKQLHGKQSDDKLQMLLAKGVDWHKYSPVFKEGTFVRRILVNKKLSAATRSKIPKKYRTTETVVRSIVEEWTLPSLLDIKNRPGVFFLGEDIIIENSVDEETE